MLLLPIFCLRLACGLSAALLLLSPVQVNQRFYRTQFLTVLGLFAAAAVFLRGTGDPWLWLAVGGTLLLAFFAAVTWSLEGAPAGRVLGLLTTLSAMAALYLTSQNSASEQGTGWLIAGELSSAALLGTATTAMLLGHSYLIAPSMSLTPLLRLLAAYFIALFLRGLISGIGLWSWAGEHSLTTLDETTLFLPVRWGIGLLAPFILGIMAWQTARIRSTQSATGILYVAVILTFLGELVSQVLLNNDLHYS
jgi:hypothetical protein